MLNQPLLAELIFTKPQLMMLVGIVLLGWIMVRRSIRARRRLHNEILAERVSSKIIKVAPHQSLPLSDAPVETQRWQVAMFDLQRELKADLDTRIAVVQVLLRQVDQRIAHLESLQRKN